MQCIDLFNICSIVLSTASTATEKTSKMTLDGSGVSISLVSMEKVKVAHVWLCLNRFSLEPRRCVAEVEKLSHVQYYCGLQQTMKRKVISQIL